MDVLDDIQKTERLVSLINKDRSRDATYHLYMGRVMANIYKDDSDTGLSMWKGTCVDAIKPLCDELWYNIFSTKIGNRMFISIGDFLGMIPDVDIADIDSVKTILYKMSRCTEQSYKMISRLSLDKIDDLQYLLNRKIDMRTLEKYKYRYDIRTLERWARIDDPSGYDKLINDIMYIPNSVYETSFGSRVWGEVQAMILSNDTSISSIEHIVRLLRSCIGIVKRGNGFVIINDRNDVSISTETQFLRTCSRIRVRQLNNVSLDSIINRYMLYLMYMDVVYTPGVYDEDVLNLFNGYAAVRCDNIDNTYIDTILNHIRLSLCNDNEELYEYILDWLSYIVQNPDKPGTVLMMIGRPGIGKTIFWEWFSDRVIGNNNSYIASTLSEITGRFNSHIANKRFILINECKGTSKHDHEYLKTLITDSYIRLEKKGQDIVQINSNHCIVVTSNHSDHHFIDEHDRRFVIIECSKYKNDISYFRNLSNALDHANDMFYTYLMNRDISSYVPSIIPHTSIKEEIKAINIHPVQQFLSSNRWIDWIQGSLIYEQYKDWSITNSMTPVPSNKFRIYAGDMIDTKRGNKGIMYKRL